VDPQPHTYGTWGTYVISLNVASANCSDSITHSIRIFPSTPVAAIDTVWPECEPYTIHFTNNSLYADTYLWDFDDGSTSTEFEPTHTYDQAGIYNVKLIVEGEGGIETTYRQVEVYRMPIVDFYAAPDTVMLPDDQVRFVNRTDYGTFYLWDFGDGNTSVEESPLHLYTSEGTYDISLDVTTENGCFDRLTRPALVTVLREGIILFPNAFKPDLTGSNGGYYDLNETEKNNIFHPYYEGVMVYHLEIWDRWGERLFYSDEPDRGWDGYHRGTLCDQGVYVWRSWGVFTNGITFEEKGDVTLLHDDKQ
jgi:PKD repeat protein